MVDGLFTAAFLKKASITRMHRDRIHTITYFVKLVYATTRFTSGWGVHGQEDDLSSPYHLVVVVIARFIWWDGYPDRRVEKSRFGNGHVIEVECVLLKTDLCAESGFITPAGSAAACRCYCGDILKLQLSTERKLGGCASERVPVAPGAKLRAIVI